MLGISIERACERDLAIGLALLAPVANHDTLVFLARDERGSLLGAAGIGWQSWGKPPGFPIWIHVLPDRRREGVGSKLVQAVKLAAAGEAPGLWAATPIDTASVPAAFALQAGFEQVSRQLFFRANAKRFLQRLETITHRLLQHSRIPKTAQLTTLDPENIDAVSDLVLKEVRGASRHILHELRVSLKADPATAPVDTTRSLVLKLDDVVVGALLTRRVRDGLNSQIIARAVAPVARKGWANPMLIVAVAQQIIADSSEWFEFDCAEDNRDTIGLARRGEADCIRIDGLFRYAVARDEA